MAERTLQGSRWRATHQATVDSILSPLGEKVRVRSIGSAFTNRDHWVGRAFLARLTEWAKVNPAREPDEWTVQTWVSGANQLPPELQTGGRGITIAETPDELPHGLAMALVGGGYHEAWHTEWSRRKPLKITEVWPKVRELWGLIPYAPERGRQGWAGLTGQLLEWANLIEDIRIERLGCAKYPGSGERMEALQDLILKMEAEARVAAAKQGIAGNPDLAAVTCVFRDLGLGYQTPRQLEALAHHRRASPAGAAMVERGVLRPLLDRAIALGPDEDLGCIWLAMEVLAALAAASTAPPPPPKPEPKNGKQPPGPQPPKVFSAGDRARIKTGKFAGREVEVTWAGIPDRATGKQELKWALVEPD